VHEKEFFTLCTALNGERVGMCGGSLGGAGLIDSLILLGRVNLGGVGLIGSLILLGHVRAGLYQMVQSIATICSHNLQP